MPTTLTLPAPLGELATDAPCADCGYVRPTAATFARLGRTRTAAPICAFPASKPISRGRKERLSGVSRRVFC